MNRLKLLLFIMLAIVLAPCQVLFAADDPFATPSNSDAGVIHQKIEDEARDKLLAEQPREEPEIESERPAEEEGSNAEFIPTRIVLRGSETSPGMEHVYDQLVHEPFVTRIISEYEGRKVTFNELRQLTRRLEDEYRKAGFFAVVYVPPQRSEKGEVVLELLLSRMGNLEVDGNRWFRKNKIRSYWRIPRGEALKYDGVRTSVEALNQNPDRLVKPILKSGQEPGSTDIYLKVEDRFPLHAGYSYDNRGAKLTGEKRHGFTLRNNNFLTLDDTLIVGTVFGRRFGAFFISHVLPLTTWGTRLVSSFSHAQVNPKKEFERFGINGISQTYSLQLRQQLLKDRRFALEGYAGFDIKEKTTEILSATTVWDRLRILSAGLSAQARDGWGIWSAGQDFYFGLPLHGDGYPLNSRGAEMQFFKYGFSLQRLQKMPWKTRATLGLEGQLTESRLVPQEQFSLGGADTVRGYPDSDFLADQSLLVKLEYAIPLAAYLWKPGKEKDLKLNPASFLDSLELDLIGFTDYGYGRVNDPAENELHTRNLLGVGGGVQIRLRKYFTLRAEWGVPLGDPGITESARSHFHFRLTADY